MLTLDAVSMSFAGVLALDAVGFTVAPHAITALIGPNGAGKTTLINIVSGVLRPTRGAISYDGRALVGLSSTQIARRGLRRTFQTVHLFSGLTVLENLVVGQYHGRGGWARALLPAGLAGGAERRHCLDLLELMGLAGWADTIATELPYGAQRRVEIARALAGRPRLLLLDEPAAGMNEQETVRLREDIAAIRASGVTILLIEHDMSLVMAVSDRIVVLDFGRKIAEGTPPEVRRDPAVISSYLGA